MGLQNYFILLSSRTNCTWDILWQVKRENTGWKAKKAKKGKKAILLNKNIWSKSSWNTFRAGFWVLIDYLLCPRIVKSENLKFWKKLGQMWIFEFGKVKAVLAILLNKIIPIKSIYFLSRSVLFASKQYFQCPWGLCFEKTNFEKILSKIWAIKNSEISKN